MDTSFEKYQKKKLRSSYISVVISIALVLFLVGVLGLLLLKTKSLTKQVKEKVVVSVFLKDNAKKIDIDIFRAELKKASYVKKVTYISKQTAAKLYEKEIGENFLEFIGANPLKNAVDILLNSDYVTPQKMEQIEKNLKIRSIVYNVAYDKPLIELLTKNINNLSFWMLLFSGIFTLIAVVLINSSIRLSVYSKRFTLKTMQMVGATKGFIRKPFILKSIQLGVLGAIVAILSLLGIAFYISRIVPELNLLEKPLELVILFTGILVLGILITWLSTFFATQRFLNLQTEELYY